MFADDIAICCEIREQVEESLERWLFLKMSNRIYKVRAPTHIGHSFP